MGRAWGSLRAGGAALLVVLCGLAPATGSAGVSAHAGRAIPRNAELDAVSAQSPTNVWMVGKGESLAPLAYHWDGSELSRSHPLAHPHDNAYFQDVDALTANSAWAVGDEYVGGQSRPLLEHWYGQGWSIISVPAGVQAQVILGISGSSPTNLWAVGSMNAETGGPLVLHRTATGWTSVKAPAKGQNSYLEAVTVLSENDVWAVGAWAGRDFVNHGLIEHWDGAAWSIVTGAPMHGESLLGDISGDAPGDVWAVGGENIDNDQAHSYVERFDGTSWVRVDSPNNGDYNAIRMVAALSPDDVWTDNYGNGLQHWNGSAWQAWPMSPYFGLIDISADSSTDAWVVGDRNRGTPVPAAQRWDGSRWYRVLP